MPTTDPAVMPSVAAESAVVPRSAVPAAPPDDPCGSIPPSQGGIEPQQVAAGGPPGLLDRRTVLRGSAIAAAGLGAPWLLAGSASDHRPARPAQMAALSAPPPDAAVVTALDLRLSGAGAIRGVLRELHDRLHRLGPRAETVTALGAALFDRAGLGGQRPRQLTAMPEFVGDVLDPARCHGDLLLSIGADSADAAAAATRAVLDGLTGVTPKWTMTGARAENGTQHGRGVARNAFGFVEGHGNPDGGSVDDVVTVRADQDEPAWAVGGSYQVVRIIQFATTLWDEDPIPLQERIIGRRRDGRWLDGTDAGGEPGYAADPAGDVTPLESHVRLANPRRPGGARPQLLRRGYGFRGAAPTGEPETAGRPEEGLLFISYQRDLDAGFAGVQRRLAGEQLARYTLTVGGGYYFVPAAGPDWWGAKLFA